MHPLGATHRSAPFVGRDRERGLLSQLLTDAVAGTVALVRVAGEAGTGRRRLIEESMATVPGAEWIDLAPGGVGPAFADWTRGELLDLLDSYPEAPVPSWALHVLSRWEPTLASRAAVPALSREPLPTGREPEVIGAAVGAVAMALAAFVPVVVYPGLWPENLDGADSRALFALRGALARPGAVMVCADGDPPAEDVPHERTLRLGPLSPAAVELLAREWGMDDPGFSRAAMRVTRGHPFFLHELVRWWEERGALRVDDETGRVEALGPARILPLPMDLRSVLLGRFTRLPRAAQHVLHLVALADGRLTPDALERRYEGRQDAFDESLALLRRRGFLLRPNYRRPLALASPLWHGVVESPSKRKFKRRRPAESLEPVAGPPPVRTPLARVLSEVPEAARRLRETPYDPPTGLLARLWRATRGRTGHGWDGARGRVAVLAARLRERQNRLGAADAWSRRVLRDLPVEVQPVLRRRAGAVLTRCLERRGRSEEAQAVRAQLLAEAHLAGHGVAAALLAAAVAEGERRAGRPRRALERAAGAAVDLRERGLDDTAELAGVTRVLALCDLHRWDEARVLAVGMDPFVADWGFLEGDAAPVERLRDRYSRPLPAGWGYGLDDAAPFEAGRAHLALTPDAALERTEPVARALEEHGFPVLAADAWEAAGWHLAARGDRAGADRAVVRAAAAARVLDLDERLRDYAAALHAAELADLPGFAPLRGLLLHSATLPERGPRGVSVFVLGRARVEADEFVWPRALWPEWWLRLLGRATALAVLDRPLRPVDLRDALAEAGETPGADPAEWVQRFNRRLRRGPDAVVGLEPAEDGWRLSRVGLRCDALDLADPARDDDDPATVAGTFLAGLDGPVEREARERLAARLRERVRRRQEREPDLPPERYARYLEGPSRLADLREWMQPVLRIRGWSRTAAALRPGSP